MILPVEEEEEMELLRRKARQKVDIVMTYVVLSSTILLATSLVQHAYEISHNVDEILRELLRLRFDTITCAFWYSCF